MKCPYCEKDILNLDYFQIALDRPYLNLKLHKDCYREVEPILNEKLHSLIESWYNINREENTKVSKRKNKK